MPFLAFDTSTERLSIAVTDGQQTWSFEGEGGAKASAQLIEQAMALLKQAHLKLSELDAVVFGRGPGSFTGLRTSCAVAQGLALGADLPILPIDTLLAVAEEARFQQGSTHVLAALDARMEEVYAAAYVYQDKESERSERRGRWLAVPLGDARAAGFELCRPENLAAPAGQAGPTGPTSAVVAMTPANRADDALGPDWVLAGTAGAVYGPRFTQLQNRVRCPGQAVWPTATALLRLAPQAWADGLAVPAEEAQPLYLRDKVAQTTLEREAAKTDKAAKADKVEKVDPLQKAPLSLASPESQASPARPESTSPPASRPEAQLLRLTPAWLTRVMAIEERVYTHPWSRGNFEDSLRAGYDLMVLVGGDTLIGYFVAMKGVEETHLLNITVAPEFQHQGWGRMMLDALKLLAHSQGAAKLWLEVRASNEHAQRVYARFGFKQAGLRKAYYAAPLAPHTPQGREDAVVMGLELTS
jgi:tRNA threonylcarbamoyladenosine biosynthesis protein TsaB